METSEELEKKWKEFETEYNQITGVLMQMDNEIDRREKSINSHYNNIERLLKEMKEELKVITGETDDI